jgi:hypothetical protein
MKIDERIRRCGIQCCTRIIPNISLETSCVGKSMLDRRFSFNELANQVGEKVGVYEIWTKSGIGLKVGIARNLLNRLRKHAASRNSGLKIKDTRKTIEDGMDGITPTDVTSKSSILAKHLYFDDSLNIKYREYNFKTQEGRSSFLHEQCYVVVREHSTIEDARHEEQQLEKKGTFRYVGRVVERQV